MHNIFNTALTITGPACTLEARLLYKDNSGSCGVIICPPHPLLAGNMENNVVQALAKTLCSHLPVLLFNYRAVGRSGSPQPDLPLFEYWDRLDRSGDFSEITADTDAVLSWSSKLFASHHLIGYSFGAYIGQQVVTDATRSFTAITPPLAEHDFTPLAKIAIPATIILAENDDLTPVSGQLHQLPHPITTIRKTDHFFRNREEELSRIVATGILQFA